MAAIFGGIAAGALGLASGAGQAVWEQDQARKSQHEQIDFQREMSNTSYQRAVKDMEAAGLNPMLAYSQGGASTPSGAPRQVIQSPNFAATALSSAQQAANLEKTDADTELVRAQTHATNTSAEATQKTVLDVIDAIQTKIRAEGDQARWKELMSWLDAAKARLAFTGEDVLRAPIDSKIDMKPNKQFDIGNVFNHLNLEIRKKQAETSTAEKRSTITGYEIPEAKAGSQFWTDNDWNKWVKELGPHGATILKLLMQMIGGKR